MNRLHVIIWLMIMALPMKTSADIFNGIWEVTEEGNKYVHFIQKKIKAEKLLGWVGGYDKSFLEIGQENGSYFISYPRRNLNFKSVTKIGNKLKGEILSTVNADGGHGDGGGKRNHEKTNKASVSIEILDGYIIEGVLKNNTGKYIITGTLSKHQLSLNERIDELEKQLINTSPPSTRNTKICAPVKAIAVGKAPEQPASRQDTCPQLEFENKLLRSTLSEQFESIRSCIVNERC